MLFFQLLFLTAAPNMLFPFVILSLFVCRCCSCFFVVKCILCLFFYVLCLFRFLLCWSLIFSIIFVLFRRVMQLKCSAQHIESSNADLKQPGIVELAHEAAAPAQAVARAWSATLFKHNVNYTTSGAWRPKRSINSFFFVFSF